MKNLLNIWTFLFRTIIKKQTIKTDFTRIYETNTCGLWYYFNNIEWIKYKYILNKLKHEKNGIGKRYSIEEIKTAVDIAVGDDGRRSAEVIEILLDAENEDE